MCVIRPLVLYVQEDSEGDETERRPSKEVLSEAEPATEDGNEQKVAVI